MRKQLKQKGFTLLEVMVVVLIAVMITVASVPIYKRNQERNRYLAATGVLVELGTAARMVLEDYPNVKCSLVVNSSDFDSITSDALNQQPTCDNLLSWMKGKNYLSVIPFENGTYKGYSFYINVSNKDSTLKTGNACNKHEGYACMTGQNSIYEYKRAWIDKFGIVINNEDDGSL